MQDEGNQEVSEQNEVDGMKKGADSTGKVMHNVKERLVTQHSYNLRDRRHNFVLIEKNSQINHRHFIIRQLYKLKYSY